MFSFISFYDSTARQNVNIVHELKWINSCQSIRLDYYTSAHIDCKIRNRFLCGSIRQLLLWAMDSKLLNMGILFRNFIKKSLLWLFLWLVYYVYARLEHAKLNVYVSLRVCDFVFASTVICYQFKIDVKCHYKPCPIWFTTLNIKPVFYEWRWRLRFKSRKKKISCEIAFFVSFICYFVFISSTLTHECFTEKTNILRHIYTAFDCLDIGTIFTFISFSVCFALAVSWFVESQ